MFIGIWICVLCMKAASSVLVWRAEAISGNSLSSNYMQIISSAVDDSKGILATFSPGIFCSSGNLLINWRALMSYIISAAWALFCLQRCRDLSMQLGILPVSSLEYWSKAMKPMQQKCWLYYSLGQILFVFNSRQSLLQCHKSSVAGREGEGREACCLYFSCTVYSQHCASRSPSSFSIASAQFRKILTSGSAVLWVSKGLFHHNLKMTKARERVSCCQTTCFCSE